MLYNCLVVCIISTAGCIAINILSYLIFICHLAHKAWVPSQQFSVTVVIFSKMEILHTNRKCQKLCHDLKQVLEDVCHIVELLVHEVIASGRQLAMERSQCWVDGLQRRYELGETSIFKTRVNQRMQQHIGSCIRLNITPP